MQQTEKFTTGQLPNTPQCPKCKSKMDGFTAMDENAKPGEGDISVCMYCQNVNVFVKTGTGFALRSFTDQELTALQETDPCTYRMIIKAIVVSKQVVIEKQKVKN